jgi:hypothetical protein
MYELNELEAEALTGGFLTINVAPSIRISTILTNVLLLNNAASVAVGVLGGSAGSGVSQLTGLDFSALIAA